ncbi:DEAD2 domain protein [Necator americanus]|uniref:DEAD2 domain protein n=1 Tax=Necator americanus TaxID=51031 RepID=W2SNA3_NECAM|nr:DEAD2 domain protein [Necator americanus]ETN71164.1 DEAD2 domain protein [Necator americanus]
MRIKDDAYDKLKTLQKVKEKLADANAGFIKHDRKRRHIDAESEEGSDLAECAPPDDYASDEEVDLGNEQPLKVVKVFYASRTHSQLEQLLDELKKTRFAPRVVTAASRQTLCANDSVRHLKFSHLINEKCMELRKGCGAEGKRLKLDGKEVFDRGKQLSACPYFSTRLSLPLCQLVLLPYQVVLHASTRAAWGIDLKGNVLVLDEAHNVLETLGSLYSAEVTSVSTTLALSLVREYIDIYRSRLKAKNLMYVKQILAVVAAIDQKFHGFYVRSLKSKVNVSKQPAAQSGIAKLMAAKKPANPEPAPAVDDKNRTYPSPLFTIKGFLEALSNRCEDGRIVDCLSRAGVESGIRRFTCSHVIDDHQLLALSIAQNSRNERFTLTYESRNNVECVRSVAETLLMLAREVPNGCVAFFTSYDYLSQFLSVIQKNGTMRKCLLKKELFVESRGASVDIWDRFAAAARIGDGAILFAVAGGKLSEGD